MKNSGTPQDKRRLSVRRVSPEELMAGRERAPRDMSRHDVEKRRMEESREARPVRRRPSEMDNNKLDELMASAAAEAPARASRLSAQPVEAAPFAAEPVKEAPKRIPVRKPVAKIVDESVANEVAPVMEEPKAEEVTPKRIPVRKPIAKPAEEPKAEEVAPVAEEPKAEEVAPKRIPVRKPIAKPAEEPKAEEVAPVAEEPKAEEAAPKRIPVRKPIAKPTEEPKAEEVSPVAEEPKAEEVAPKRIPVRKPVAKVIDESVAEEAPEIPEAEVVAPMRSAVRAGAMTIEAHPAISGTQTAEIQPRSVRRRSQQPIEANEVPVRTAPPAFRSTERTEYGRASERENIAEYGYSQDRYQTARKKKEDFSVSSESPREISAEDTKDSASFATDKELVYRHELKFYINYRDYMLLRQSLKALIKRDKNGDDSGRYLIRSLYFDDRDETALEDKLQGTDSRYKYRVRIYNYSAGLIRFEKKIKEGQFIAKKSMPLTRDEYEKIINEDYTFLLRRKEALAHELYLAFKNDGLRPRVVVDYTREAYIMDYERVRITFDMDIKSGRPGNIFDPNLSVMPMLDPGTMVLEVKFGKSLPDYIMSLLEGINGAQRSAISKYVICRKYE